MFLLEGSPAPDHVTFARFRSIHFTPCSKRILAEMSNALFDMEKFQERPFLLMVQKLKPVLISILSSGRRQ